MSDEQKLRVEVTITKGGVRALLSERVPYGGGLCAAFSRPGGVSGNTFVIDPEDFENMRDVVREVSITYLRLSDRFWK